MGQAHCGRETPYAGSDYGDVLHLTGFLHSFRLTDLPDVYILVYITYVIKRLHV